MAWAFLDCLHTIGVSTKLFRQLESLAKGRGVRVTQVVEPVLRRGLESVNDGSGIVIEDGPPHDPRPIAVSSPPRTRKQGRSRYRVVVKRVLADRRKELLARSGLGDAYSKAVRSY